MPAIGLTGNFGMGKSTVLDLFKKLGAHTFDVDSFVHNILNDTGIIRKVSGALGAEVVLNTATGKALNKKKVAEIIFNDQAKRKVVEHIIHPKVLKEIKRARSHIIKKKPDAIILFEVPLLFEAGYEKYFDKTIVVHSKRKTAIHRLTKDGFTESDVLSRLRSQLPIYKKKLRADFLVENNGDIKRTAQQVKKIFKKLQNHG